MSGPLDHVNLKRVQGLDDAMEFKRWLSERRRILGVDTETSGFKPDKDHVRLIQFGDLDTGWAIEWNRWSGLALEALNTYEGDLVLHNSKFDTRFIVKDSGMTWPWHRTNDTMAMAHLVNPLRAKGLKPLSAMMVDPKAAAAQKLLDEAMTKNKWTWATVPVDFPYYWIYAAMDPVLTCHIYEKLIDQVQASYWPVYELEMGTTRVIAKMEAKGARVDLAYAERKHDDLMAWSQAAKLWITENFGLQKITDAALVDYFTRQGFDLTKLTNGGSLSMDKEVLQGISHPVAEQVLLIRKAQKIIGPYFKNFLAMADENDRVHPNIWTMGTKTARMSITEPALQTLPRKDPTVRTAFIPSEGNALITCDYDQIEARLAAHFSRDPGMIAAFTGSEDFFCAIASGIFNEPISKKDERRQLTKGVVYGKLYGAGTETMARTASVAHEIMEHINAGFDSRFPGLLTMQRDISEVAMRRLHSDGAAYVTTPTGRRLVSEPDKIYTLTNYLIQSHAAEVLKKKILELDAVLDDDWMILPVHDELVFDVPLDVADEVRIQIEETMKDDTTYLVPITASSDLLTSDWGQKYREAS